LNRPPSLPPELADALRQAGPRLGIFAGRLAWFPTIGSTNDVAAQHAERGAPEGTVIVADEQTAGRGRLGRVWASPPGAGLYVSAVLRPSRDAVPLLTIAAGVAAADAVEAATGLASALKWPNDVYVGTRKLAGILAEVTPDRRAGATAERAPYTVILGIGLNVLPAAYPPDIAARATSLEGELGRSVDRGALLAELLAALAARYDLLQRGGGAAIAAAWRRRAMPLLNRRVRWTAGGAERTGVAENIDDAGALLVRTAAGLERIISGEVTWA
jgi:BirA family biotin operon repressor/biotin-[acetyl-CoA-carboxylase] ligase